VRAIGHFQVAILRLRANPARDACFRLVQGDTEMHEYEATTRWRGGRWSTAT
jgi:hypothetical protein